MSRPPSGVRSAVEALREGFRQLEIRAKEKHDAIAAAVATAHHRNADKLIVSLGGDSVFRQGKAVAMSRRLHRNKGVTPSPGHQPGRGRGYLIATPAKWSVVRAKDKKTAYSAAVVEFGRGQTTECRRAAASEVRNYLVQSGKTELDDV